MSQEIGEGSSTLELFEKYMFMKQMVRGYLLSTPLRQCKKGNNRENILHYAKFPRHCKYVFG